MRAGDLRLALAFAAVACAVAALAAAVVAAFAPESLRQALDFGFAGVPRRLDEALTILGANARLMAAVGGAVLVVQAAHVGSPDGRLGAVGRLLRLLVDVLLGAVVALNAVVVGAAVGAYGSRMVVAMLPHGPVELLAFSLAITLYLRARAAPLRPSAARLAASALGLLTVAAFLETYVHL